MANRFFPNYDRFLITSRFGQRVHPITKLTTQHNGIDMTATNDGKIGQTDHITAHTGGTVEAVGFGISAGNYVKIRVDSRTVMVYYHLKEKSTLQKGAVVKKGDVLGYMGKTGSATGPHLHFGIQFDGAWIDPAPYLEADWAQPVKWVSLQAPVLKKGAKGRPVQAAQALLNLWLGQTLEIDGSFGAKTLAAVEQFQTQAGLAADGSVGAATWSALLGE